DNLTWIPPPPAIPVMSLLRPDIGSTSNINYLSKLPIEIWREIFLAIPWHPSLMSDESTDPLRFLSTALPSPDVFRNTHRERLSLLTVCKALLPFAEESLYSRVGLTTWELKNGDSTFREAAMSPLRGSQMRRGEVTTHLWVITTYSSGDSLQSYPLDLHLILPNLRSLYQEDEDCVVVNPDKLLSKRGFRGITTLSLGCIELTWQELKAVALSFPKLTVLKANPDVYAGRSDGSITFPFLETLVIDPWFGDDLPLHKLNLPSLRWLSMGGVLGPESILPYPLLKSIGRNLVGVELGESSADAFTALHKSILDNAPNLKTLIFHLSGKEPGTISISSHNLEHLSISVSEWSYHKYRPSDLKAYLYNLASSDDFPSLDRITIVFEDAYTNSMLNEEATNLVDVAKEIFSSKLVKGTGRRLS
ncbi:hypothetical protein FRC17_003897, partial [Serendipita sp. 399]